MIDFVEYVVSELSNKRLSKADALALIRQFHLRSASPAQAPVIHPLLHRNTSDLNQQSYTSDFSGEEFFLRDHRVEGQKVLPGVAYLEMARMAIETAVPQQPEDCAIELRNIVWAQPIVVTERAQVSIGLSSKTNLSSSVDPASPGATVDFEIYSVEGGENDSATERVHSRGLASVVSRPERVTLDLEQLRAQMTRGTLPATALYTAYEKLGLSYGPAHQAVTVIHQGEQQLLARLSLPAVVADSLDEFGLHPSLMDAALQSALGLVEQIEKLPEQPMLPFALESLQIFSACVRDMFAWVRYAPGSQPGDAIIKLDIDLCDPEGNVCSQLRGFTSRVLNTIGAVYAAPAWEAAAMDVQSRAHSPELSRRHVVLCGLPTVTARQLEALVANSECLSCPANPGKTLAARYSEVSSVCFELIKKILQSQPQNQVLVQLVIADNREESLLLGLSGLLKTAAIENPAVAGQIILTEPHITPQELAQLLRAEEREPRDMAIRHAQGSRQVLKWGELEGVHGEPRMAFKDQGVYWITGGLGGLGVLFAREILEQTADSAIILTGRSELTPEKQSILASLSSPINTVEYRQLNLADPDQVRQLLATIVKAHKRLSGIIHCAGMISDSFILKKTSAEFREVLEPKVSGTFNLDEASKDIALDFMVLFSAGASVTGNIGQADYAAANGFLDQFAAYRNRLVSERQRSGKTVAINWPLWQDGGMQMNPAAQELLRKTAGVRPLKTSTGVQAFYRSLQMPHSQIQIVEGDLSKLRRALNAAPVSAARPLAAPPPVAPALVTFEPSAAESAIDSRTLQQKTQEYLKKQLAPVLKLASNKIDAAAPFEKYGIDSILTMELTAELEKTFGSLPKTLFFEYQTLSALAKYFIESHAARLSGLIERPSAVESRPSAPAPQPKARTPRSSNKRRIIRQRDSVHAATASSPASTTSVEPIAIIGLSGRYPGSSNISEYWRNLRDGKDCIVEVPKDRWDWREYFSEDRSQPGHHYSKWGGFIEGVDEFDPLFFGISPREAKVIDPQERLFLQHAWMAVEDAGYTRATLQVPHKRGLPGQVGVYVGVMYGEYNLSGSLASIANRVSYVLNLHGPSMTLDTMCSSSLTAIHLACQDLKQGRTDIAIAGGVNVSIHPSKYLLLSAGQFISSDGHCQSFGEGGDGYIPGEGVGAVVLKRLSEAKRAGDPIYGVIRGSSLNHGGKTNGYTVPNPQAQASVIRQAFAESQTNPRHISYIEAHGTGTKLGDPIEIAALTKAFYQKDEDQEGEGAAARNDERGFCAIGSAKSNIGHCESAAGIAGLTKVLLQMQQQQIVPSLHSTRLNPNIDFSSTPFVVNQSLRAWDRPVLEGRELPRMAGLSSFGAGGANAHLIIEEYVPSAQLTRPATAAPAIIPLSARTAEQLKQRARDLLTFIRSQQKTLDLPALAYTLQVGREALEERLGLIVGSIEQLAEKLQAYVDGARDIEDAAEGQVKNHKDALSLFTEDADLQATVEKWISRGNLSKLLDWWVKGLELSWDKLYGETKPARISLPTYPFAREKYWIENVGQVVQSAVSRSRTATAVLHPLIHVNASDLSGQRYTSVFRGDETFFSDHSVPGQKAFAGTAFLEMARAAVTHAVQTHPESSILELHGVAWGQPLMHAANQRVTFAVSASANEQIDFEIYSEAQEHEIVHCQGQAAFSRNPGPERLDIAKLRARLQPNELLAHVSLPALSERGQTELQLHPSLMEAALQAAAVLIQGNTISTPHSLESLRVVFACVNEMFAWARYADGKLDIDLCDPQGNVCVQMRGLSLQPTVAQPLTWGAERRVGIELAAPGEDVLSGGQVVAKPQLISLPGLQESTAFTASIPSLSTQDVSLASLNDETPPAEVAQDDLTVDEPAPVLSPEQLQQQLRASLAEALYMQVSDIDNDKPFVEMGLDSIVGVEWVKVISKQYGLSIAATRVYDHPNITALASFVAKEIADSSGFAKPAMAERSAPKPMVPKSAAPKPKPSTHLLSHHALKRRTARAGRAVEVSDTQAERDNRIAIVGMSGRYPQANNLRQYWDNLLHGRNSIVEIPASRWDVNQYYDSDVTRKDKVYCKWLGMLDDVECFDPLFFQISPAEAESMDPQHRLFMQEAYRAFEDAGYSNKALSNKKCGVYLGIMSNEYSLLLARNASTDVNTTGNSYAIGAARIPYYLNLKGPAIPIDTACSSSLVAIHLACQALLNRETDLALAGGVSVYLTAESYLGMCQAGMLSPDGQCKAFDDSANGFVPGEGVGAVVLKRLQDAEADGDLIYGIILGSGINQDGKTNGITAPSVSSQIELERELYAKYKIDPETISYVETHGTGTKLGDPIELEALATVFAEKTSRKNFCGLGSVKSNIGHTSGAAGVASVQKVLLSMRHQTLVPSLNVEKENALFDFKQSPFYICRETQAWSAAPHAPRRAAVSSFGFSGTNAHLVLEEYWPESRQQAVSSRSRHAEVAVLLSARDTEQLRQKAQDLLDFVLQDQDIDLAATAYTLQVGREAMKERLGFVAGSIDQLTEKLKAYLSGARSIAGVYAGQAGRDKDALAVFSTDADLRETVNKWLAGAKLTSLLELWVKGLELDWSKLYSGQSPPRRISLPTYPFVKERYWIDARAMPVAAASDAQPPTLPTAPAKQRTPHQPLWKVSALQTFNEKSVRTEPLLVVDSSDELHWALKQQMHCAILVKPGESYQEIAPDVFTVDVQRPEHFHQLIERLKARDQLPRLVVHHCPEEGQELSVQLNHGIYLLLSLCKSFMAHRQQAQVRILSVSSGDSPQHAALGGFFRTLTLENPKYLARTVEIQASGDVPVSVSEKTRLIMDEFQDSRWGTAEVRYEQHPQSFIRKLRVLAPCDLREQRTTDLPLKQNGVYLITGGLGGLALIFAEYLIKRFRARLVLLGRSALTPAQEAKLLRLKSVQPDVIYLQADVSRLSEVERAVQEAKRRFSQINGVIHAAGVTRDSFILKKTREEMASVLAPKVHGAVHLDHATREERLDLFVMFSSVAGAIGNPGQCDYAYGNHFLDAFAESRARKRLGKTLSINWPFWMEGGMTLSQTDAAHAEERMGISPLPTAEGIQFWEAFLRSDLTQAVALYGIASRIESYVAGETPRDAAEEAPMAGADDLAALLVETENYLAHLIGEEIKLAPERIDARERFEVFGIDSIVIGRLNAQLTRDLGELSKTLFYEYATIEELARHLAQEAQPALMRRFGVRSAVRVTPAARIEPAVRIEDAPLHDAQADSELIAIIGVHGTYPQSKDLAEYWENLRQGRDFVDVVPANRWDAEALFDPDPEKAADGKIYCKWGAFLEDFDKFDPLFFNISADEAGIIDPQERLFLGSVWSAIEDAGYTRDSLKKYFPKGRSADVGVFVGVTTSSSPLSLQWSIANRVSYVFDFQGPSMPVDTACSSSLVALHLACESLKKQDCQLAIAGGVNLYLHPAKYQSFCRRRMLALAGKCRSFGAGDDGFVPGEGVGTVVLKPLSKAIAHGDHIHAVIRASAFEHSGRSNGYSAPNPNSQASLISQTLRKGGIHPESISYVEGHGTGTQLGDSLEMVALTQAFRKDTSGRQFCPVGSAKANLGHSESAAGIAGVTKVLLQMKHQQLVPTIHSNEVNPNINFKDSPFYLQHELTSWEPCAPHPRRALVNSFGAGGVNACVVLEEYQQPGSFTPSQAAGPFLIILSAKNEDRLLEYLDNLLMHVQRAADINLADLSYTLQVGREAMPERLALIVTDVEDLVSRLEAWRQRQSPAGVYRGSLEPHRRPGRLSQHRDVRDLSALAEAWIAGEEEVDWEGLYATIRPSRISLPTYPFARESYPVSDRRPAERTEARLHPLVSYNSSTLNEVSFSSLLTSTEFYARDHKVNDQMIFPGSGFLEIACVSGALAAAKKVCKIQDVVWVQPLVFSGESQMLQIALKAGANTAEYVITSYDDDREKVVHCEGMLQFHDSLAPHAGPAKPLAIEALKERCPRPMSGAQFYSLFERSGISYGPAFRTLQELYIGDSFALSRLQIADHLKAGFDEFILHPCIIDGALQTVAGLIGGAESPVPHLPFAIDTVEIIQPTAQSCYVHVEQAASEIQSNAELRKFNIQIVNESGVALVVFTNFCVRAFKFTPSFAEMR